MTEANEGISETISTDQEAVHLLREILGSLNAFRDTVGTALDNLVTLGADQLIATQTVVATTQTIATTLDTFLADWIAANTPIPGPAVSASVVWGEPQPIP